MDGVDHYPMMAEAGWPAIFPESVLGAPPPPPAFTPPAPPPTWHFPIVRNPFNGDDLTEAQSAAVIAGGVVVAAGLVALLLRGRKQTRVTVRTNKRSARFRKWGSRK